ncbi:unnamed protein product [Bursaphelenchus okinawaensis]|uniref:Xaa-Pro dipeptidase n=1 Tax=Bursaphelenchus okinawaensis TaxID=465554 RepID=A0A811L1H6_9BILA|nr:unnamed protein product [Bursaphelenchus okinawaensis]CAG9114798.1 unnamed protein product [Bursaphelenchus okinawaensis]
MSVTYQLGDGPPVLSTLFKENRRRLIEAFKATNNSTDNAYAVLEGGHDTHLYNTDMQQSAFRQESYFYWTFGVTEPEVYGIIDLSTGHTVLLPPKMHKDYAIWQGSIKPESYFKEKYDVEEVVFHEDRTIESWLRSKSAKTVYLLKAFNTDSKETLLPANFTGINNFKTDTDVLYNIIAELRVFKTDQELELLRYASKIGSDAHKKLMKNIKPGKSHQYQMESLFTHESYSTGACRHIAYTCIAASGADGAVLHYGHAGAPNDHLIKDGDLCLFDMGPEYSCYTSDVTCTFPANGKFTEKQRLIYNAVYEATMAVFREAKPGVCWTDMHLLAERIILEHLKNAKILTKSIDEMVEKRIGAVFFPCGLGHFLGLDVHDVGGYLGDATERSTLAGLKNIRTTRTLQERMVITIEPGVYFIDTLLDEALANPETAKYFNKEVLQEYRGFGGVRIEDDVVIWVNGNECINDVPRTVEEIEEFMKQ